MRPHTPAAEARNCDVPGLLVGDLLYAMEPNRNSEADARVILRMAMTGESLNELTGNLRKAYGPLMSLNLLMKLMAAKEEEGKTLFYSDLPEKRSGASSSDRKKRSQPSSGKFASTQGQRMIFKGPVYPSSGSLGSHLIQTRGAFDYFRAAQRVAQRVLGRDSVRKRGTRLFASLATSDSGSNATDPTLENASSSAEGSPDDSNVMEAVPLEVALRLLTSSKEKYSLVVKEEDRVGDPPTEKTPVFPIRGVEVSVDTTKGPVSFVPMFFSKKEVQKTFSLVREFLQHLWLSNRAQKRSEICKNFISTVSSFAGMDGFLSDQRPTSQTPAEEQDEEDAYGNGDPPEIKEFIEELGEASPDLIPQTTPVLLGLPFILLLGCLTVSTTIWKECTTLWDMALLHSPLESSILGLPRRIPSRPLPLESFVSICQKHNAPLEETRESTPVISAPSTMPVEGQKRLSGEPEVQQRQLNCLRTLQLLLTGVWQLAYLPRRHAALHMVVDKTLSGGTFPGGLLSLTVESDLRTLRKSETTAVIRTIIEVDEKVHSMTGTSTSNSRSQEQDTVDLQFAFNLKQAFDESIQDKWPEPSNPATALGICLIGNLGLHSAQARVPSLGFTDVSVLKDGLPCHVE